MSRNSLPPSAVPSRSQHTPQSSLDLELQPLRHKNDDDDDDDTDYHSSDSALSTDNPNLMARTRRAAPSGDSSTMNTSSSVEFRRKAVHPVEFDLNDSHISSASQTAALLERESFQLDSSVDPDKPPAGSFKELSKKDQRNFLLLVLLYFLQGVPMGLAMGSVPFLLKSKLSYGQIGVFTLASYPYSMKLLWSPIVDAIWSPRWGRRKSWIVPVQAVSAVALLWLGAHAEKLMEEAEQRLYFFTFVFFVLVMLCATQDIAVDGWALTLLSPENLSYASTAQTVGLTAGQFLSFTVFLALSAPDFANRYFRSTPLDYGLITLSSYLTFWGWIYLLVTLGLAVLKREDRTLTRDGIGAVYRTMWRVMKLRHVQTFIVIHLISKIGFQANDAVTNLKLLDKGFSQEDLALTVLIDFPFELVLGYYAGKWCQDYMPMSLWRWAFVGRIIAAILAHLTVWVFPSDGHVGMGYLLVVITSHVFSTFTSTVMFVAGAAFHAKIADPEIGGTYMTLLATVSNLGGTFPRIFVLKMVDAFTQATCTPSGEKTATFEPFSCALEGDKHRCRDMGGVCEIITDGYYITNVLCVLVGVVTFWGYIRPATKRLSALPLKAWREASGDAGRAAQR